MSITNNKKTKKHLMIFAFIIIPIISGITYAYFSASGNLESSSSVKVGLEDLATLIFTTSGNLGINVSMSNFSVAGNNLSDTITGTARLSAPEEYSETYNIYYTISDNTFIYTTGATETPELILQIKNPKGELLSTVEGLEFVTSGGVSGFDITTKEGTFAVFEDYYIHTDGEIDTYQDWEFTLYFMNLETSQNANAGKNFESNVTIQRYSINANMFKTGQLNYEMLMNENDSFTSIDDALLYAENKAITSYSLTSASEKGIYATEDDLGISYYYRGDVDNNWIEIAGTYWRIVRVAGDGTVKLIYAGDELGLSGLDTQIGELAFNTNYDSKENIGYVYSSNGSSTSSTIKDYLDTWYTENLESKYDDYIYEGDFCIDRSEYPNESDYISYGAYYRLDSYDQPTLKCSDENDIIKNKIGLISLDEVSFAGINLSINSYSNSYLNTGSSYWTMSPSLYANNIANVGCVNSDGYIDSCNVSDDTIGIRPTIYLNANVKITGDGTRTNPYKLM
ncbi:MAG: hypothetical protein R3Y13_01715 [bacterium]